MDASGGTEFSSMHNGAVVLGFIRDTDTQEDVPATVDAIQILDIRLHYYHHPLHKFQSVILRLVDRVHVVVDLPKTRSVSCRS